MSNLAAGYIQNLAQDEGEQLKDALDKARQLDQAHYREAQAAARGDKYFGDSSSHKNILASVSQKVTTAAMERTLPKGEVNEEALLRDFLEPSDMERAIAAELAKVNEEILGGRNESRWTDYANFGKGIGKELGGSILNLSNVTQQVMYDVGHLEQAREDLSGFGRRLGQGLQQSSYIAQRMMYDIGHPEQGMEDVKSLYGAGKQWLQEFSAVGAEQKGEIIGQAAVTVGSFLAGGELLGAGAAGLASRFAMFGRAAEVGEVGAEKSIGLTSRLNRAQIRDYLSNVREIPREQLIKDLESAGLKLKGESPDGLFKTFEDKVGNIRVKLHPQDSITDYSHLHVYNKSGNSLTANLTRAPYDSPDVHMKIEPIERELEWRPGWN